MYTPIVTLVVSTTVEVTTVIAELLPVLDEGDCSMKEGDGGVVAAGEESDGTGGDEVVSEAGGAADGGPRPEVNALVEGHGPEGPLSFWTGNSFGVTKKLSCPFRVESSLKVSYSVSDTVEHILSTKPRTL